MKIKIRKPVFKFKIDLSTLLLRFVLGFCFLLFLFLGCADNDIARAFCLIPLGIMGYIAFNYQTED